MPRPIRSAGSNLNKYLNGLRREGFEVTLARSGHWRITWQGQYVAGCSASPRSDGTKKTRRDVVRGMQRLQDGQPWTGQEGAS